MNKNTNADLWIKKLEDDVVDTHVVNFKLTDKNSVRITNEDYEKVFKLLLSKEKVKISDSYFDEKNDNTTLYNLVSQARDTYESHSVHTLYATFGLLDYYKDYNKEVLASAPLVFVPVKLVEENGKCYISSVNKEIRLNDALIFKMLKEKKVSLEYPLDKNFSLSEYLYYVAVKVQPLGFSVNNGCFLTRFDLNYHDKRVFAMDHIANISNTNIVKNLTYFNSEFFNFKKTDKTRINSRYLALLDTDFDEYRIVKKIAARENLFVRTSSKVNKLHLLENSIEAFLLNSNKVLVAYENQEQYKELKEMIEKSAFKAHYLDLNSVNTDKKELLLSLTDYDRYVTTAPFNTEYLGDHLKEYYDLKNRYKQLINSLRVSNPSLNISLNKMLEQYYRFYNHPDINLNISNISRIDDVKLTIYMRAIENFKTAASHLNGSIKSHPFYGFSRSTMLKEDYVPLRKSILTLSEQIKYLQSYINTLNSRFGFPVAKTLKQLKAELNMLTMLRNKENCPLSWFNDENLDKNFQNVLDVQKSINTNKEREKELENSYGREVFKISDDQVQIFVTNSYTPKDIAAVNVILSKNHRLNEQQMIEMMITLDSYRTKERDIDDRLSKIPYSFKSFYHNRCFDIEVIRKYIKNILEYRYNVKYLENAGIDLSKFDLMALEDATKYQNLMKFRSSLQKKFNETLDHVEILQSYFDENTCNFGEIELKDFYHRMIKASNNFSSINDYLDLYLARVKLNKMIDGLGDQLFDIDLANESESIFLKAFYRQTIEQLAKENPLLKEFSFIDFIEEMKKNDELSEKRDLVIDSLLNNNVQKYLHNNGLNLKKFEAKYASTNYENADRIPLKSLTYETRDSIFNLKGLILCPINEVQTLLNNETYHFDGAFVLPTHDTMMKDVLSIFALADQYIVFDDNYIKGNLSDQKFEKPVRDSLIDSASKCFETVNFLSKAYETSGLSLKANATEFKTYLFDRLEKDGFEIIKDAKTETGFIDILVRPVNSRRAVAICIDRLLSHSLESSLKSIQMSEKEIRDLKYIPYRIIPIFFFLNSDEEYNRLRHFIIVNTDLNGTIKRKKVTNKLAMEVLFDHYISPRETYYMIDDKMHKSLSEIVKIVIEQTAPVNKGYLLKVFSNDDDAVERILEEMLNEQLIAIKDDFIYVIGRNIEFRIVERNTKEFRPIDSVSNIELKSAITKIVLTFKEIEEDTVVKMILLSLGYKKAPESAYNKLVELVDALAAKERIIKRDNVLYKE